MRPRQKLLVLLQAGMASQTSPDSRGEEVDPPRLGEGSKHLWPSLMYHRGSLPSSVGNSRQFSPVATWLPSVTSVLMRQLALCVTQRAEMRSLYAVPPYPPTKWEGRKWPMQTSADWSWAGGTIWGLPAVLGGRVMYKSPAHLLQGLGCAKADKGSRILGVILNDILHQYILPSHAHKGR